MENVGSHCLQPIVKAQSDPTERSREREREIFDCFPFSLISTCTAHRFVDRGSFASWIDFDGCRSRLALTSGVRADVESRKGTTAVWWRNEKSLTGVCRTSNGLSHFKKEAKLHFSWEFHRFIFFHIDSGCCVSNGSHASRSASALSSSG